MTNHELTIRKLQRKVSVCGNAIVDLQCKRANLRHEVKRLEDLLLAIYRLDKPEKEFIRGFIEERIPRRIERWKANKAADGD